MNRPRVLLAEDHLIVAEGLRSLIEPEFEIVGIVGDGRSLVDAAARLQPDVIVTDISMPQLNGFEAIKQIKASNKDVRLIFLTMHADVAYARIALEAGALGYILKHSAPSELSLAIRCALKRKVYITPILAGEIIEGRHKPSKIRNTNSGHLTRRQYEVLQLLAEGHSSKEVASILNISSRTVEYHKYQIMKDTGMKTSAELVRYAVKHGIVGE